MHPSMRLCWFIQQVTHKMRSLSFTTVSQSETESPTPRINPHPGKSLNRGIV